MKRKGFTLVELLGVIVILGVLGLISLPPIINLIKNMRNEISDSTLKLIYSSASRYMSINSNTYPLRVDANYCITLEELVLSGNLEEPIIDANTGYEVPLTKILAIDIGSNNSVTYELINDDECNYIDASFAEAPSLSDNMIPVTRSVDDTKWVKADLTSEWYNYNNKKWANAVFVTSASRGYYKEAEAGTEIEEANILMYYVWVPRYRYKITNSTFISKSPSSFEIIFEGSRTNKSNGTTNGSWKTHPAFTFNGAELNGIWVAKFEAGYSGALTTIDAQNHNPDRNKLIVKPNVYSWRGINVYNIYSVMQELNDNGNIYGLISINDVHLTKNSEWGAISYLTYSKYGKNSEIWINSNSNYLTGCAGTAVSDSSSIVCKLYDSPNGLQASSTGNIYGIYDLSGGANELVMAATYNSVTNINLAIGSTGFTQGELDAVAFSKYVNKYNYGTTYNDQTAYNRSLLGDAMGEVRGWNSDNAAMPYNVTSWLARGGSNAHATSAGIFYFARTSGINDVAIGFRPVIINQ